MDEELKVYYGDWPDLCRGPHLNRTSEVGTAFKLTKVAGAYQGDLAMKYIAYLWNCMETQKNLMTPLFLKKQRKEITVH